MSGGNGGAGNGGGGGPPGGGDPGMTTTPAHAPPGEKGGGGYEAPTPTGPSPHVDREGPVTYTTQQYDLPDEPDVPSTESLLRGDINIFSDTQEVKEPINPFEETYKAGQPIETSYAQKADDVWENKQIINTTGGEMVVDEVTGEMHKSITDFHPDIDQTITQKTNLDKTDPNSKFYEGVDRGLAVASAKNEYDQSVENFYDEPDKEHFNQTQREINTKIKEAKKDDRYDVSLTPEQSEQFQEDMNEHYGTENKNYEEFGRAGKGTVNLTFEEHWKNAPILHPALKFSPSARFLYVIGKQSQEALTSDYGTYKYAGPGTDRGGLLGSIGGGGSGIPAQGITISGGESSQSSPEATSFITTGHTQPSSSVAGNWYQSLGGTKAFNLATEYAAAKAAVQNRLSTASTYGWLAVNDSPFYNWLKTNSLDKGIL